MENMESRIFGYIKRGRPRDLGWDSFTVTRDESGKKILEAVCKICNTKVSPKGERVRNHLMKFHAQAVDFNSPGVSSGRSTDKENALVEKYFQNVDPLPEGNDPSLTECLMCHVQLNSESHDTLVDHIFEEHPETLENNSNVISDEEEQIRIDLTRFESQARGSQAWYWKFFEVTQLPDGSNRQQKQNVICKLCGVRVSPRGTRIRKHFRKYHLEAIGNKALEDLETPEESTLIKKYFTASMPDRDLHSADCLAECTLCQIQFKTDKRSLLIDHLFDLHSDTLSKELEHGSLDTEQDEVDDDEEAASLLAFKAKLGLRTRTSEISPGTSKTSWYSDLVTVDEMKKAKCNLCQKNVTPKVDELRRHVLQYHAKELELDPTLLEEKSAESVTKKGTERQRPVVWKYFQISSVNENGKDKIVGAQCIVCKEWVSPKVDRLRIHCRKYHPELEDITDTSAHTSSRMKNKENKRRNPKWIKKYFDIYSGEGKDDYEDDDDSDCGGNDIGKEAEQVRCRICYEVILFESGSSYDHLLEHHPGILEFSTDYIETEDSNNREQKRPPCLKVGRKKDFVWTFFRKKKINDPKNSRKIIEAAFCIRCNSQVSPRAYRLWLHLKNFHPDINNSQTVNVDEDAESEPLSVHGSDLDEVNDDPIGNTFGEYVLPESPVQHVEESQEYKYFPSVHLRQRKGKTRSRKDKKRTNNNKCVLCRTHVSSNKPTSIIRSWNQSCAKSLCELFNVDNSCLQYFEGAKYCKTCEELVRNIDFTQRTLKNLNKMLETYRHAYESMLQNNFEDYCTESHSSERKYVGLVHAIYSSISHGEEQFSTGSKGIFEVLKESKRGDISLKRNQQLLKRNNSMVENRNFEIKCEAEKKPKVEYTSKYGRVCNSVSCSENIETTNQDETSSDAVSVSDGEPDWVPDSPKPAKKEKKIRNSQQVTTEVNIVKPKLLSGVDFLKQRILLGRKARRLYFMKKQRQHSKVSLKEKVTTDSNFKSRKPKEGKKLVCQEPNCKFSCYKKKWLETHFRARHENDATPFLCDFDGCGKKFTSLTSFAYHSKRHTAQPIHSCNQCGKLFFEKWAVKKHFASAHTSRKEEKCSFCSKTFKLDEGDQLKEHEELHEAKADGLYIYGCVLCNEQHFTNSFDLKTHVIRTHNLYIAKCHKCGKVFKLASSLRKHLELLHCEKNPNLNCSECDYQSQNKYDLVRHLSTHRSERPYLCAECGATYPNKNNLKVHMMLHSGEAPYKCKFCSKAFNQSSKLKAHEEIHVPTKNYVCDKCGKSFRTAKNIYQHKRFHCHERMRDIAIGIRTRRILKKPVVVDMDTEDDVASDGSALSLAQSHNSRESVTILNCEDTSSPEEVLLDAATEGIVEEVIPISIPQRVPSSGPNLYALSGHFVPWAPNETVYTIHSHSHLHHA